MWENILIEVSNTYQVSLKLLSDVKYHVAQFVQVDLGLESHLQLVLSIILLLLVYSETRTIISLEVIFEEETLMFMPTSIALALSITWSLYSCISAHLEGIAKKRQHTTFESTMIILLFTTTSIFIRVFSYIMFLTPCLGLLNCLRHLQGEMFPFYAPYYNHVNASTDSFYFGNGTSYLPWKTITRWKYIGYLDAEPPNQTIYTVFSIEQHFGALLSILVLNVALQTIIKSCANQQIFKKMSWIDCLVHSISCTFIPYPMEDWDEEDGSMVEHKIRQALVLKEMGFSMMLNFGFNLFLLSPIIILGKNTCQLCTQIIHFNEDILFFFKGINVFERHNVLLNSIGIFSEEIQAYEKIKLMLIFSYTTLVILTIVQAVSYYFYNGKFHPYAMIVMPKRTFCQKVVKLEPREHISFKY